VKTLISRSLLAAAVIGCGVQLAAAQPAPPPPPPPDLAFHESAQPLEGVAQAFNFGPDGNYESLVLSTADNRAIQLNFPPFAAGAVAQAIALGDKVTVSAYPRMSMPDHPVYELVTIAGPHGASITIPQPDDQKQAHVDGVVQRLNYARDGRVNGAVLESGDFVQVGPQAAALNLAPGQKLSVDGMQRPTVLGKTVIRATNVNGTAIQLPPPPGRRDRGPEGRGLGDRGPGDRGPGDGPPPPPDGGPPLPPPGP
jgi:hypothetical protein